MYAEEKKKSLAIQPNTKPANMQENTIICCFVVLNFFNTILPKVIQTRDKKNVCEYTCKKCTRTLYKSPLNHYTYLILYIFVTRKKTISNAQT